MGMKTGDRAGLRKGLTCAFILIGKCVRFDLYYLVNVCCLREMQKSNNTTRTVTILYL